MALLATDVTPVAVLVELTTAAAIAASDAASVTNERIPIVGGVLVVPSAPGDLSSTAQAEIDLAAAQAEQEEVITIQPTMRRMLSAEF